jgi:hypothetical protein
MLRFINPPPANKVLITIGEEGAVITYVGSQFYTKCFARSINDTEKLLAILKDDPSALVYIYIDTLDQNYYQKYLPSASSFGIKSTAYLTMAHEVPDGYFKTCELVARSPFSGGDWIFNFISVPFEDKVKAWINFLLEQSNTIAGICFLPLELSNVLLQLKSIKKPPLWQKCLGKCFKSEKSLQSATFDVLLTQHRTGGFRLSVYYNNKVVVSRLLSHVNAGEPTSAAKQLNHEISASIDYVKKLAISKSDDFTIHAVLAPILLEKIANNHKTNLYTPQEFAGRLGVARYIAEDEKFCDYVLAIFFGLNNEFLAATHNNITQPQYRFFTRLKYLTMIMAVTSLAISLYLIPLSLNIYEVRKQIREYRSDTIRLSKATHTVEQRLNSFIEEANTNSVSVDVLHEVSYLHLLLTSYQKSPIDAITALADVLDRGANIKKFKWTFHDTTLSNINHNMALLDANSFNNAKFSIGLQLNIALDGANGQLIEKYKNLQYKLKNAFADYNITFSKFADDRGLDVLADLEFKSNLKSEGDR